MATLWTLIEIELAQAVLSAMVRRKLSRKEVAPILRKIADAMEAEQRRMELLALIQAETILEGGQDDTRNKT